MSQNCRILTSWNNIPLKAWMLNTLWICFSCWYIDWPHELLMLNIWVHILGEGASTQPSSLSHTKLSLIPVLLFKIHSLKVLPSQGRTGRKKSSGLKRAVTLVKNKLEGVCKHCATGRRSKSSSTGAQLSTNCRTDSLYKKYLQLTDSLLWACF